MIAVSEGMDVFFDYEEFRVKKAILSITMDVLSGI